MEKYVNDNRRYYVYICDILEITMEVFDKMKEICIE